MQVQRIQRCGPMKRMTAALTASPPLSFADALCEEVKDLRFQNLFMTGKWNTDGLDTSVNAFVPVIEEETLKQIKLWGCRHSEAPKKVWRGI